MENISNMRPNQKWQEKLLACHGANASQLENSICKMVINSPEQNRGALLVTKSSINISKKFQFVENGAPGLTSSILVTECDWILQSYFVIK